MWKYVKNVVNKKKTISRKKLGRWRPQRSEQEANTQDQMSHFSLTAKVILILQKLYFTFVLESKCNQWNIYRVENSYTCSFVSKTIFYLQNRKNKKFKELNFKMISESPLKLSLLRSDWKKFKFSFLKNITLIRRWNLFYVIFLDMK